MSDHVSDRRAFDELMADLYERLRKLAKGALRYRGGHAIVSPTELVNDCYIELANNGTAATLDRTELMAFAARAIRSILVDHVRKAAALKRGGGLRRVTLSSEALSPNVEVDLLKLDVAFERLAGLDERQSRVVELRFLGGLTHEGIAQVLGCSPRTVNKEWAMARAWLHRELDRG